MKSVLCIRRLFTGMVLLIGLVLLTDLVMAPTAWGMDFTLYIYGNANGDQNLDQADIDLLAKITSGEVKATELSDANQDGKIDQSDIDQVKRIMAAGATEIFVRDAYGKPIKVKTPVKRIISMDQMITENAQVLGIGDTIVGIDQKSAKMSAIHPDLSRRTNIGAGEEPDIEMMVGLKPDLVLNNQYFDEDLMSKLSAVHLTPLAMIYHGDIQNSLGYSKLLGYLAGSPASASEYIDWMTGVLDGIHDRISTIPYEKRTKVIYLYPRRNGALGSGGNNCPTIRALQYLGANTMTDNTQDTKGVVMDSASYFEIDPEVIISKNPEAIVMEDFDKALGYSFTDPAAAKSLLEEVVKRPGFAGLDSVKNNRVYLLDVNIVSHSNCLGAIYMAKALYPRILADVDPCAIHQEYVNRFLKLADYNVKKDGLFIYPPIEK